MKLLIKLSLLSCLGLFSPAAAYSANLTEYALYTTLIKVSANSQFESYSGWQVQGEDIIISRAEPNHGALWRNPFNVADQSKVSVEFQLNLAPWTIFNPQLPALCLETSVPNAAVYDSVANHEPAYATPPDGGEPVLIGEFVTCVMGIVYLDLSGVDIDIRYVFRSYMQSGADFLLTHLQ